MVRNVKCYVCNSEIWSLRAGCLRDAPEVQVRECRGCGVVTPESPHGVTVDYRSGSMFSSGGSPRLDRDPLTSEDISRRLRSLAETLSPDASFLDFGCGVGEFLVEAELHGLRGFGVELCDESRKVCRERGVSVWESVLDIPINDRKLISVCTLFHVLEHLKDPRGMIADLIGALPNLKVIFVEVPAADDPLLGLYESDEFSRFTYWSHHEHLHSTMSLALVCSLPSASLKVERVQRYGIANHLGWLVDGEPGGHLRYADRVSCEADLKYRSALIKSGYSDTLWCEIRLTQGSGVSSSTRTFCFDIDGTLCTNTNGDYTAARPLAERIRHVNHLYERGNRIVLQTARGATSGIDWSAVTRSQLEDWGLKYHELLFEKPFAHLHVDDKAVNADHYSWASDHLRF